MSPWVLAGYITASNTGLYRLQLTELNFLGKDLPSALPSAKITPTGVPGMQESIRTPMFLQCLHNTSYWPNLNPSNLVVRIKNRRMRIDCLSSQSECLSVQSHDDGLHGLLAEFRKGSCDNKRAFKLASSEKASTRMTHAPLAAVKKHTLLQDIAGLPVLSSSALDFTSLLAADK